MKDSWEAKNDFVNLLYEKGYLTEKEHRCLLTGIVYNGKRYINVYSDRAWFKDNKMSAPFLLILRQPHKLDITILENGRTVDSSVVEL